MPGLRCDPIVTQKSFQHGQFDRRLLIHKNASPQGPVLRLAEKTDWEGKKGVALIFQSLQSKPGSTKWLYLVKQA